MSKLKSKIYAEQECDSYGHTPVNHQIPDPFTGNMLYPGIKMFDGEFLQGYPCSSCGQFLSEKEIPGDYFESLRLRSVR